MTTHHVSLYHSKTKQPDITVLKQELITYQQTSSGLKITKLERSFSNRDHLDKLHQRATSIEIIPGAGGTSVGSNSKAGGLNGRYESHYHR